MAEVVLHPDPVSAFPPGTQVKIYKRPVGAPSSWAPSGAALSEPIVSGAGALKVEGLEENALYVATAVVGGATKTLYFQVVPASSSTGAVASVNGKVGVVVLTAADVEAIGSASPAFTGTPTAPTAAPATNSTQLATTAYADAIAALKANLASPTFTGTPKAPTAAAGTNTTQIASTAYADAIDALAAKKASNLSDLANTATARGNLGLGTAATQATGAFDAAGTAATAQTAAEGASTPRLKGNASVSADATLAINKHTSVDASGGARKMKLPEGEPEGSIISVEKSESGTNTVTVEGSIRGEAGTTTLRASKEVVTYVCDAAHSWWPISRTPGLEWQNVTALNANMAAASEPYAFSIQAALGTDGMVRLAGVINVNAEIAVKSILFNLPAACRPEKQHALLLTPVGNNTTSTVLVKTNGDVETLNAIKTTASPVSIDSLSFRKVG